MTPEHFDKDLTSSRGSGLLLRPQPSLWVAVKGLNLHEYIGETMLIFYIYIYTYTHHVNYYIYIYVYHINYHIYIYPLW